MISYWKSVRAEKAARRQYELARIEGMMADLERERIERQQPSECPQCVAMGVTRAPA